MNMLPRFPGTSWAEDAREEAIEDALDQVDRDYAKLVTLIEQAQQVALKFKGDPLGEGIDNMLCDALAEAEEMKRRAEHDAMEAAQ